VICTFTAPLKEAEIPVFVTSTWFVSGMHPTWLPLIESPKEHGLYLGTHGET